MRRIVFAFAAFMFSLGCSEQRAERLEWTTMGTVAAVQFKGGDSDAGREAVGAARETFREVEKLLNAHDSDSELNRLAKFPDEEILRRCDPEVRDCYAAAFRLRDLTGGRFDPRWRGPGTLDLGAIAKGFAVDLACEKIDAGRGETLVDLGGNLKAVSGRWRTLVAKTAQTLVLTGGMACATSAEYFRGSHIRDAKSGAPVKRSRHSVTVVHPSSAMLADGLSTVMFILGRERGEDFLRRFHPEARAIWSQHDETP